MSPPPEHRERPIGPVRGTRDRLPALQAPLAALQATLLDRFAAAGYVPVQTPVLEFTELHERKSGAGIVARLFELADAHQARLCLRPELTAGLVRAYVEAPQPPPLPWRVSLAGPVFRFEPDPQPDVLREFTQVGVELLGAPGPAADAEVIALAIGALDAVGLSDVTLRIGHVGLILELLDRSGLPASARSALVETLSLAAAEGRGVAALETALEQFAGWLEAAETEPVQALASSRRTDDRQVDRLFKQLVPDVIGRRSGHEILGRLRRKWDLAHTLNGVLGQVRDLVHQLAELHGPAPRVLEQVASTFADSAPDSVAGLRELLQRLQQYGVPADRIELDLGFGRGIGFYTQMIFELSVATPSGPLSVGGGGRYDGLARVLGADAGRDDRGVGFAFGLERLQQAIHARQSAVESQAEARGCLVVAAPGRLDDALGLIVDLRRLDGGRWHDGGPIIGVNEVPATDPLAAAQTQARSLGLASVVLVQEGRFNAGGLQWSVWDGSRWGNDPTDPMIRLAQGKAPEVRS